MSSLQPSRSSIWLIKSRLSPHRLVGLERDCHSLLASWIVDRFSGSVDRPPHKCECASFGDTIHQPTEVYEIRQAVQDLGAIAVEQRTQQLTQLTRDFVRYAKKKKFRSKIADSLGGDLSGGQLLMRSLILRKLLSREVLDADEQFVELATREWQSPEDFDIQKTDTTALPDKDI